MVSLKYSGYFYLIQFEIGHTVYIKTDPDQMERIITEVKLKPNGTIMYEVSCDTISSFHYDFELSTERNIVKLTTN